MFGKRSLQRRRNKMTKAKSKKTLVYENKLLNLVVHHKVYDKKKLIKKEKQNDNQSSS